jgi:hypothetical protein
MIAITGHATTVIIGHATTTAISDSMTGDIIATGGIEGFSFNR